MSAAKDEAFVLRTQDYRETSLLATFFTREHGKIRGIVKGIRDTRARFGSTLEPFSLNEILFYRRKRGGDLHLVTQVETLDLFRAVREDLDRLSFASYFTELLNELTEAEDPSPEAFDLMKESLKLLSSGVSAKRAARIFEIKLLELTGLMPETRACVVCRAESPDPAYFNPAWGGIRCAVCQSKAAGENGASGLRLSQGTLHFIDHVQRANVGELANVKVAQGVGEELERMLRRFVDYHLSSKLKSMVFLEKMGLV